MAQTNQLTGSQIAKFKTIELHKVLKQITDSRGPRKVTHMFPYRDGAKQEVLGRRPHRTEWLVTFTGPNWLVDFLELANSIDDNPGGILIHPIYGQMQVVCEGFDRASVSIPDALDTIDVPLAFVEDQVDLGIQQQATTATLQQNVNNFGTALLGELASYLTALPSGQDMVDQSNTYAAAAFESASSGIVDSSLQAQLDAVGAQCALVEEAILADPAGAGSALIYDALAAAEVLYVSCLLLADEVALETLGFQLHVVQGEASLAIILANIFGSIAITKYDQALRLNSTLLDPTRVPIGFNLILPL